MVRADPPETPLRLLLVDDHQLAREGLVELLRDALPDAEIEATASATEAYDCCAACPPDLILLDFRLPDGDGVTVTGTLRSIAPQAVIIVLTADPNAAVSSSVLEAGAAACIDKAGDLDGLLAEIQRRAR